MIFPKTQVDRFYKEFWPERRATTSRSGFLRLYEVGENSKRC